MLKEIPLKDTNFIEYMQISLTYLKEISKNQLDIISLKTAISYMQCNINDYKIKYKI